MSGFEVAGIVLGAIPLVISALEHYKAGKGLAASFIQYSGLLDRLIFRLKLQQTFFSLHISEILREAGVEEAVEQIHLSEDECVELLRNVNTGKQVEEYLGQLYIPFMEILKRYEICLKTICSSLGGIRRLPNTSKDDLAAIVTVNKSADGRFNFKERLSFTIKRRHLSELLDNLTEEQLSLNIVLKGIRSQRNFILHEPSQDAKRLLASFSQIRPTAMALSMAMCQGYTCNCTKPHTVMMRLESRLHQPRELRRRTGCTTAFNLVLMLGDLPQEAVVNAVSQSDDDASSHTANPGLGVVNLPKQLGGPKITFSLTSTGADNSYNRVTVTNICQDARQAHLDERILHLHLASSILSCLSKHIKATRKFSMPTSFEEFLIDSSLDKDSHLTPKQRTILALDVAAGILQLRETTWLSLPWNKKSIKLLPHQKHKTTIGPFVEQIIDPKESCSADKGPLDGPDPKTVVLELAILLMEIWHHQTMEAWASEVGMESVNTPDMRYIAATRWLERTSEWLPPHHLTAVEHCLAICSGRLRRWNDEEFLIQYCENVIKPLRESCKAW